MIVAEVEEYGFVPVPFLVGAASIISAGVAGYLIGRKESPSRYYECVEELRKRGVPVEEASRICGVPYSRPRTETLFILAPVAVIAGLVLYKLLKKE